MLQALVLYGGGALLLFYGTICLLEWLFPLNMADKAILVTGCDTGFGHDFVIRCAQKGMVVFAGCHLPETPRVLQEKCRNVRGRVLSFHLDVGDDGSIDSARKFVESRLPVGQGLHALVSNAGVMKVGFDDWIKVADYEECLKVNTFGSIRLTEKFKDLVKRAKGRIVLVGSIAGRIAIPGFGPFVVSKFAIEGYADTIRLELHSFGVKVSIIEPGFHRTAITSPQYWVELFGHAWEGAAEDVKFDYGGKVFLKKYNALLNMLLNSPLNSTRVDRVVDAYFDAVSALFPKKRYLVGKAAKFFFIPLSMLPACVTDSILRLLLYLLGATILEEFEAADTPAVTPATYRLGSPPGSFSNQSLLSSTSTGKKSDSAGTSGAKK